MPTTSQLRHQLRMHRCEARFREWLATTGHVCTLHCTLSQSDSPCGALQPSNLRELPAVHTKVLGVVELAGTDYLLASQRSATQDRALHRTSPLTALKSLRLLATEPIRAPRHMLPNEDHLPANGMALQADPTQAHGYFIGWGALPSKSQPLAQVWPQPPSQTSCSLIATCSMHCLQN